MIAACRRCGKLVEMTTEEAYTPAWCCQWYDRLCRDCYEEERAQRDTIESVSSPALAARLPEDLEPQGMSK